MTINECMVLQRAVKGRLSDLRNIQTSVAAKTRSTSIYGDTRQEQKDVTPQYDVKLVDIKITEIELFLMELDSAVKQKNAITTVDITVDKKALFAPIQ